jgi:hypothetical protein
MSSHTIAFTLTEADFKRAFGRKPKDNAELHKFYKCCEDGIKDSVYIDWDIVFRFAKRKLENQE